MKFTYTAKGNENSAGNKNHYATQNSKYDLRQNKEDKAYQIPHFDVVGMIGQVVLYTRRVFVYFKYVVNRLFPTIARGEIQVPWFKIGVIGVMVFILFKKDLRFSVNMKGPLSEETNSVAIVKDELGFAKTASFLQPSKKSANSIAPSHEEVEAYIKRFKKVARTEYQKYGIPVSVKMGQAILASRGGLTASAKEKDNHFGLIMDDENYNNAWENWRMHSLLLKEQFFAAFEAEDNYKAWAQMLQKEGYSKDREYAKKLIQVIEKYNLDQL